MEDIPITAYCVNAAMQMPIVPALASRTWMNHTPGRFAYRCLPMLMANQSGWHILSAHRIEARWNGGIAPADMVVEIQEGDACKSAESHFGSGILTFTLPYLFRTPPGWNILARGPANSPKDGIAALEGVTETDWCPATFTMNWQFTRPGIVRFEKGEPVCMIVPQRRGELEQVTPRIMPIQEDTDSMIGFEQWKSGRSVFTSGLNSGQEDCVRRGWQKDYFKAEGETDHQVKLCLREFRKGDF